MRSTGPGLPRESISLTQIVLRWGIQPYSVERDDGQPALSCRPTGTDLRQNREELLDRYQRSLKQKAEQPMAADNK